jgi:uncharacterized protein YcnI
MKRLLIALALCAAFTSAASAHVTVRPRESVPGAQERYTVRVPTEGAVSTTKVELIIPDGVTVTDVPRPAGAAHDLKRVAGRIVSITWTKEIKPKEVAEFVFVATNPQGGPQIVWKAHQHFADGTSADWTGPPSKRPASTTKLVPK